MTHPRDIETDRDERRGKWVHEDELINQRTTWLINSQSFLFAGFLGVAALASDAGMGELARFGILVLIPLVGLFISHSIRSSLAAAREAMYHLAKRSAQTEWLYHARNLSSPGDHEGARFEEAWASACRDRYATRLINKYKCLRWIWRATAAHPWGAEGYRAPRYLAFPLGPAVPIQPDVECVFSSAGSEYPPAGDWWRPDVTAGTSSGGEFANRRIAQLLILSWSVVLFVLLGSTAVRFVERSPTIVSDDYIAAACDDRTGAPKALDVVVTPAPASGLRQVVLHLERTETGGWVMGSRDDPTLTPTACPIRLLGIRESTPVRDQARDDSSAVHQQAHRVVDLPTEADARYTDVAFFIQANGGSDLTVHRVQSSLRRPFDAVVTIDRALLVKRQSSPSPCPNDRSAPARRVDAHTVVCELFGPLASGP